MDTDQLPDQNTASGALQVIADASANLDLRSQIQDDHLFSRLLSLFSSYAGSTGEALSDVSFWKNLLRCIGNLIADNGKRRIYDTPCLEMSADEDWGYCRCS